MVFEISWWSMSFQANNSTVVDQSLDVLSNLVNALGGPIVVTIIGAVFTTLFGYYWKERKKKAKIKSNIRREITTLGEELEKTQVAVESLKTPLPGYPYTTGLEPYTYIDREQAGEIWCHEGYFELVVTEKRLSQTNQFDNHISDLDILGEGVAERVRTFYKSVQQVNQYLEDDPQVILENPNILDTAMEDQQEAVKAIPENSDSLLKRLRGHQEEIENENPTPYKDKLDEEQQDVIDYVQSKQREREDEE